MRIQGGFPARGLAFIAGTWLGGLLTIGLIAAPSAFHVLDRTAATAVVARLFALEAPLSLLLGMLAVLLERSRFRLAGEPAQVNSSVLLALGAVFCTVAGYYALRPLMDAARAGQGHWSFGQLHALSLAFYGLKIGLVTALSVVSARVLVARSGG